MRVRLKLKALKRDVDLPLNYQSSIAAFIYAALDSGSSDFARRLHDIGYQTERRSFRLFTFSRLETTNAVAQANRLTLQDPNVTLQISSPMAEFMQHLINGFSREPVLHIAGAAFDLIHTELIPPPIFREQMAFRALSPITASINGNEKHATFLNLDDDWSGAIRGNLVGKYQALHGREPNDSRLIWTWSRSYITKAERRGSRLSMLVDLHGIKIRGWLAPFTVEGSKELIELGYEAGFGARNSMGFGMAEADEIGASKRLVVS